MENRDTYKLPEFMNNVFIQKLAIHGLFGYKNIVINFDNPVLIIIGENGFGKTTILNVLNYVIQGEFKKLSNIPFSSIDISIGYCDFSFTKEQLSIYLDYKSKYEDDHNLYNVIIDRIGQIEYEKLKNIVLEGNKNAFYNFILKNKELRGIPDDFIFNAVLKRNELDKNISVFDSIKTLISVFDYTILWLPTYRRVEVDLEKIRQDVGIRKSRNVLDYTDEYKFSSFNSKYIQFGMNDVETKIREITHKISESFLTGFAETSGDMIRHLLKNDNHEIRNLVFDKREMEIVLARIGNALSKEEKEMILHKIETNDRDFLKNQYLLFFLDQLLQVYKKQEKYDRAIKEFCRVCNKYFKDKEFLYDESNVKLEIYRKDINSNDKESNIVHLNQLSSGEKQIVSIFAQIYLDVDSRFIVLLDEPELSLSIFWQENLLPDIIESGKCSFLLAATHSPFIFGDKLKNYTVGISEFLQR